MPVDASKIRTVAVVGHASSGKTSLIDGLLFITKAVTTHGRVANGTSAGDALPDEIERKITIHTKPLYGQWQGHQVLLLDTPGFADFYGETMAAIRAADAAIVVIDGVGGIEVGTRRIWRLLDQMQKPRLIFVSKLDKENADFFRCVEQIRAAFGKNCIPFELPVGAQSSFAKVINLRTTPENEVPAELKDAFGSAHESLVEAAAEQDDKLLEKYLGGEGLTMEEITGGTHVGVARGAVVPIFCGCAEKEIGLRNLLDGATALLPSPADRGTVVTKDGGKVEPKASDPFSGFVFKVTVDPYAGHLAYVRVISGTLRADMDVLNTTRGAKERVPQLLRLQGKTQTILAEAGPGEIVALVKLKDTHINDTLSDPSRPVQFPPIEFPKPVMSYAVHPHTTKDEEKISVALHRLVEEDPTFHMERNPNTKELVISGMGDQHLAVVVDNLKKRLGVNVDLSTPKVDYKETITARAEGHYKHKKQSGGRGQYGEAYLKLAPTERGAGFQFVDEIVGGAIPRNFIPAVEKGCVEALLGGVVAGFPVVDVQATVYDGSFHDVDSNEISFKIAGLHAFKDAMQKARPVLLEPIMNVAVYVPDQYMGDITGDLNHRRGRIMGVEPADGLQCIKAQVPQAELFKYASELRSMTGGRASFEMDFSHYEQVPQHVAQKVIAEAQAAKKAAQEA
ncbi:MAG TPA: elongation factor G [Verrucomicrobiae bacterium]|nr:elongation factor G [Verrucomicrobiae bacterium]